MKTLYDVLGVDKKASQDEIKIKYRKLAFKHHPDNPKNDGNFSDITNAYSILSNRIKRLDYDADPTSAVLDHSTIVRQRAIELISTAYITIIDTFLDNIFKIPIIDHISQNFSERIVKLKTAIGNNQQTISTLEKVVKRLHSTTEVNLLSNITQDRIGELTFSVTRMETEIEVIEKASSILEEYSYDSHESRSFVNTQKFNFLSNYVVKI